MKPENDDKIGSPNFDADKELENLLTSFNIYLSDGANIHNVKEWLHNRYSGYPDLVETLMQVLHNKIPGKGVPLDNINLWYGYAMNHNKKTLKAALVAAWREKNDI